MRALLHQAVSTRAAQKKDRVDEVKAHGQTALHRCIVCHELEQHEAHADRDLTRHEYSRCERCFAHAVTFGKETPGPHQQTRDGDRREAARRAVPNSIIVATPGARGTR